MAIGFKDTNAPKKREQKFDDEEEMKSVDDLKDDGYDNPSSFKLKPIHLVIGVGVVIVLGFAFFVAKNNKSGMKITKVESTESEVSDATGDSGVGQQSGSDQAIYDEYGNLISANGIYTEDGEIISDDAINPGIADYDNSDKNKTTPKVYSDTDFVKDLNGVDVSAVYNVQNKEYIQDYVNYETRRAIIDEGMEMYWLEAVYKGKKYRLQVPFYYFKDLDESGICKVEIELLTLEGGAKVISYMQIISDND